MSHSLRLLAAIITIAYVLVPSPVDAQEEFEFVYFPHEEVTSRFSNDWGDVRSGGRRHQGNDIFAEKHSPVVAVADGFITAIGENTRSGYYVRIEHRDGWETWYMHLNNDTPGTDDAAGGLEHAVAPGLEEGMFVSAGTVIGYVGDSGNAEATSCHTHFELHDGTRTINPFPYLTAAHDRWMRVLELNDEVQ